MATTDKEFLIRVRADITRAVAQMHDLSGKLEQTAKSGQQASRNTRVLSSDLGGLVRAAVGAAAALGAIKIARDVVQAVDTYSNLNARLRLVTNSSDELARAQTALFDIAQLTRKPFEDVAALYVRLSQSGKELGASQEQLLKFTEGVGNAITLSGSSSQEAAGALQQLSQGLSGAIIQAQEFNSINDGAPEILRAVARNIDGVGGSIGKLRQLVVQQKLTNKEFFQAFLADTENLKSAAQSIPRTVGQALIQLQNDVQRAFSGTETQPLIDAVDEFRDKLSDPEIVKSIVAITNAMLTLAGVAGTVVIKIAEIGQGLAEVAGPLVNPTDLERLEQLQSKLEHAKDRLSLEDGKVLPFFSNRLKAQIAELEREIEALRARLEPIQVLATPAQIKAANTAAEIPPGPPLPKGGTPGADGNDDAAARDKARQASEKYVQALELEEATYGLTRIAQERYELGLRKIEPALRKRAEAALDSIDAQERATEIEKQSADAIEETLGWIEEINEAERERKRSLHEQAEALRDQLQPSRELIRELERFQELLDAGEISLDEYRAALQKLGTDASDVRDDVDELTQGQRDLVAIAADAGSAIADGFEQAVLEGEKFSDVLKQLADDLLRIAFNQLITQQLAKGIAGAIGGPAAAQQVSAGVHHEGGIAGTGLPTRPVSPLVFAGAPHYHLGGFAGLKPNEVPAILEAGEEILPRDHPRHRANASERSRSAPGRNVPADAGEVFEAAIIAGQKLRRSFDGVYKDIQRIAARPEPFTKNIPTGFTGLFAPQTSAHGNIFQHGDSIPFARGGVVHEPVFFPMAEGTGLMGEAGPEGILPLKRTRGGDLGVSAEGIRGGGIDRVIINNYGAAPARTEQQRNNGGGIDLVVTIGQAVAQDIGNNGPAARAMQGAFGLRRSLTRR